MLFRNRSSASVLLPLTILFCAGESWVRGQAPVLPPGSGQIRDPQQAYTTLRMLAGDALAIEDSAGRKRVWIADGVLHYDLRAEALTALAARPDCFTRPLEVLTRSAALRRDLTATIPNDKFWNQPLERSETLAKNMVRVAYQTTDLELCAMRQKPYETQAQTEFQSLGKGLDDYARNAGLSTIGTRGVPTGFKVQIHIDPPRARIRFMPFLDYKRCQYFSLPLDEHWNDLQEGTEELIGRYHYRAEWPASLNGPEEGNFDIHENGAITFRPRAN
jgi:hypothetical protein